MSPTATRQRSAQTFDALRRHFGFSDARLAEMAGYTGSQVEWRRKGKTPLDTDDFERFGAVFQVEAHVFLMDPADAIRYVLDHGITVNGPTTNYGNRWRPALAGGTATQDKPMSRWTRLCGDRNDLDRGVPTRKAA